jgi:hypothetical protein
LRFTIARLCGGKALMAASREPMDLDMARAAGILSEVGRIKEQDEMMLAMEWNGMEVTVYPQGKVMFFPLSDKDLCIEYSATILGMLV